MSSDIIDMMYEEGDNLDKQNPLLEELNRCNRDLQEQLDEVQQQLHDKMGCITELENEVSECQRRVEMKEEQNQALKQESEFQLKSVEEKLKLKLERRMKDVEKEFELKAADLSDDNVFLKSELDKARQIEEVLRSKKKVLEYENIQLQEQLKTKSSVEQDIDDQDRELQECRKLLSELTVRYEVLEEKYITAIHNNTQLQEKNKSTLDKLERIECSNTRLENIISESQNEVIGLKMEIERMKSAEPGVTSGNSLFAEVDDRRRIMERQLKQFKAKNESLQDNFNLVSRNRDSLKKQLFAMTIHNQAQSLDKARIKELKKHIKSYETDIRELNNTVFSKEETIKELRRQIDSDYYTTYDGIGPESDIYKEKKLELDNKKLKADIDKISKERKKFKFQELFVKEQLTKVEEELYFQKKLDNKLQQDLARVKLQLETNQQSTSQQCNVSCNLKTRDNTLNDSSSFEPTIKIPSFNFQSPTSRGS